MFTRIHESVKQPFWIVLIICVTFLIWSFVSLTLRTVAANQHQEAYIRCARETNVKAFGLTKSNIELMRACLLGYGYKDDFN